MSATTVTLKCALPSTEEEMDMFIEEEQRVLNDPNTFITNSVRYLKQMKQSPSKHFTANFDDITEDLLHEGFVEIISGQDRVHLYFDFDDISTEQFDKVVEVIDNKLVDVFGLYSIAGYSNDEKVAKRYDLKFIPEAKKRLSVHIVFYEKCVAASELEFIMKSKLASKFWGFDGIDGSVYTLSTSHTFRHMLSPKYVYKYKFSYDEDGELESCDPVDNWIMKDAKTPEAQKKRMDFREQYLQNHNYYGKISSMSSDSDILNQIVTPKKVFRNKTDELRFGSDWFVSLEHFNYSVYLEMIAEAAQKDAQDGQLEEQNDDYLEMTSLGSDELVEAAMKIIVDSKETIHYSQRNKYDINLKGLLWRLIPFVKGDYDKLNKCAGILSPILSNTCSLKFMDTAQGMLNRQFYCNGIGAMLGLVKRIDEQAYTNTIKPLMKWTVATAKINWNDEFCLRTIRETNYCNEEGQINTAKLLYDLQRVMQVIDVQMTYVVKDYDAEDDQYIMRIMDETKARHLMQGIKIVYKAKLESKPKKGEGDKAVVQVTYVPKETSVWDIYNAGLNKNVFLREGMCFVPTERQLQRGTKLISFFTGWRYKQLPSYDAKLLEPWFKLIEQVSAAGNKELAERIHKWIAYPLQNPGKRNGVALVFVGEEGCGKSLVTDIVCNMFGKFAEPNIDDLQKVFGKNNAIRENKALIIINEKSSSDEKSKNSFDLEDKLKSPITDNTFPSEDKWIVCHKAQNVNNFIFCSNHNDCLKLTGRARRYQVMEVSEYLLTHRDEFKPLFRSNRTEEFMQNLFTYYMTLDLTNYNPEQVIVTEAREEMMLSSKSSYELFVEENCEYFYEAEQREEWEKLETHKVFELYKHYCEENGYDAYTSNRFCTRTHGFLERCANKYRDKSRKQKSVYRLDSRYRQKLIDNGTICEWMDPDANAVAHV